MTLREKIARLICEDAMLQCGGPDSKYGTMRERVENNWRDYTTPADAVLALLSDPANISDGMILAMIAHYEMMSFDPPAPNVAHVRAVGMFAEAPALKERFRESFAAAFTAKESETK